MALSPRKRYGLMPDKREPVEVSFGVGTRAPISVNGVALAGLPEKCQSCGNVFLEDAAFCRNCGRKREAEPSFRRPVNTAVRGAKSEASESSVSPQRYWQVEPLTSSRPTPVRQQAQEKESKVAATQDSVAATSGSARDSLRGLAAERDRLQRQVQEMRSDVSNARQDLTSQHGRQKGQTDELRGTLQNLQAETERLQSEQRRQAATLKSSLKAGDPAVSARLEKQVEGVASIVKNQEERFDRLETDITSAYESQRKQLQQALAENRQLAKGLEEDSQRRQSMMMELMEKVTRNSAANQLSSELANATTVIQGQTADWSQLSRQIRQEVTGLAVEMKADRDSRALESASGRVEIVKMVEDARRQGAMEAIGLHDAGGLTDMQMPLGAEAMISRPGILAVHNLVDINCKILRDMESQLIIRAGFVAGVFHTWHYQATLMKTGRQYEEHFHDIQDQWTAELDAHRQKFDQELADAAERAAAHKEHVRMQHDLLLRQWMLGDAKGLFKQVFRSWTEYVAKEKNRRKNAASIHKVCYEWVEGKNKGLKHSCFAAWFHEHLAGSLSRKREEDLEKVRDSYEAELRTRFAELDHMRRGASKALEKAVAKWKDGDAKGMTSVCFRALKENAQERHAKKAKDKSVEMAIKKFLLGQSRGMVSTCWISWKKDVFESQRVAAEHKRFEELLNGERARLMADHRKQLDEHALKIEAAHNAVELVLKKWLLGDVHGLRAHVYHVWSKWSIRQSESEKKLNAVHMSLAKWARGDAKGVMQTVFFNWKNDAKTAAAERQMEDAIHIEHAKLDDYLAAERQRHGDELAKYKSEAEIAMAKAHASVMASVSKWAVGEDKGNKKNVFQTWAQFTKQSKLNARSRQAVHASLLASFMNKEKAALLSTFKNWLSLTRGEKAEREKEDVVAQQQRHWEAETDRLRRLHDQEMRGTVDEKDRLKAQAQATTELALKKWIGNTQGSISEYFTMWRRLAEAMKDSNRKRTAVKDAMSRFIEGERRGVLHSVFLNWKNYVQTDAKHQAQISKLEKQVENLIKKQELSMQKYGTFLAGSNAPALKGLVFRRWFEMSQGEKMKVEYEREREVQLEEMAQKHKMNETRKREVRAKALSNLGVKGSRVILLEVFLAWSYQYQKTKQAKQHKMSENHALTEYSKYLLGKKLKQDNKSLLASTFSEWHREGKILKHEEAILTLEERDVYIAQLKAGFEEQLAIAYQQIDQITETLQKELQTKEELAHELREAYEKSRKMNLPDYPATPGSATPGSRPRPTRPTSVERTGNSLGVSAIRPARHSMPGACAPSAGAGSCSACGNAYVGEGNFCRKCGAVREPQVMTEPLSLRTPTGPGALPSGSLARGEPLSASNSGSPRAVNWAAVVERLEDRGLIHDVAASGRRY